MAAPSHHCVDARAPRFPSFFRSIVAQLLAATFTAAPKNPREEASVEVVDQEVDVLNKLVQFVVPQ